MDNTKQELCPLCAEYDMPVATSNIIQAFEKEVETIRFCDARAFARMQRRSNVPTHRIHAAVKSIWGEDIKQLVTKTADNAYYLPSDRFVDEGRSED